MADDRKQKTEKERRKVGMIRSTTILLLLLLSWPAGLATAGMQLSEILKGIQKRYKDLPGLSIPYKREIITRSMALLGGSMDADMASGHIHFRSPKFLRVQQDTPKPETIISDGNTLWWYVPHKNQVYQYPSHQLARRFNS